MKKFWLTNLFICLASSSFAHTPIYIDNQSKTPLVSPLGVVIKPQETNVWRISPSAHPLKEHIQPRPWRKVCGCTVAWKGKVPLGKTPYIKVHQKKNHLICKAKYASLKIIEVPRPKKKTCQGRKKLPPICPPFPPRVKEEDELYILPPKNRHIPPAVPDVMVYSIPEREEGSKNTPATVKQSTKLLFLEKPLR